MIINSQKRSFGRGAKVSLFTLGTMRATESLENMYSIIKNAYAVGINHIETAPSYGDAEVLIGNSIKKLAIEENIKEKSWVITTKVLPKGDLNFLKNNFKNSLKNLNREKINNLAIHGLNLKQHLDWVLSGEGKKFISWILEKELVDQVGFSSHGSYSLIKDAINCEAVSYAHLTLPTKRIV